MKQKIVAQILIADDEPSIRRAFKDILNCEPYEVDVAIDGDDCLAKVKSKQYDVILLDLKMPNKDGMECLKLIPLISPQSSIIVLSGNADPNVVAACFRHGATDYLEKPSNLADIVKIIRENVGPEQKLKNIKRAPQYQTPSNLQEIVGQSEAIEKLRQDIKSVAFFDKDDVLIMGGNGAGKELVAQCIHHFSPRKSQPLIEMNCGAISPTLIMSTLFGYLKNSFSDAKEDTKGLFQAADGGTLFLDEIGDMTADVQVALLRAIESGTIMPLGSTKAIKVNVRIVAATNKNLYEEVRKGVFRQDLLYRLERFVVRVPSLNERLDDIPLLVEHFRNEFYKKYEGLTTKQFSKEALLALQNVNWLGNVRQLKNVLTKLLVHSIGAVVTAKDVDTLLKIYEDDWNESL
jgi:two-component system, NtrC family, nitrogen regulation response regulator NtrX